MESPEKTLDKSVCEQYIHSKHYAQRERSALAACSNHAPSGMDQLFVPFSVIRGVRHRADPSPDEGFRIAFLKTVYRKGETHEGRNGFAWPD